MNSCSTSKICISLVVDKLSMELIDGRMVSFYVEKERLMRILRHQVMLIVDILVVQCS